MRPEKVSDVLTRMLKTTALGHDFEHIEIYSNWRSAVGNEIARHTRIAGLKGNKLLVEVDSSPWLYELRCFRKKQLIEQLGKSLKKTKILDIEFKIAQL